MSITFGIFLLSFTAGTAAWATVGERIAKIPTVARALDYVNGGYAIPSDAQVDKLELAAAQRREAGVADRDALMPGTNMTYGEHYESTLMRLAVSEDAIEYASKSSIYSTSFYPKGWRGWLAGGYNMPTAHEVDNAYPRTLRGAYRGHIDTEWIFRDENPQAYDRTLELLYLAGRGIDGSPLPRPEQCDGSKVRRLDQRSRTM